ncbi:hypothetical protein JKF63_02485 [Porcisia hertigi]|uniref:PTHB1 n=1 Tax=Porcisia hertigi TaxID=2761500 RepID=A0A836HNR9_9TRYP|nr:hypothetical protein JKF63_02485 [Porcisia hertigi]
MGSLFQLRDFWYTSFPGEEFSTTAVALVDSDVDAVDNKIIIGSFQGILRLLSPSASQGQMPPGDVLFEKKYDEPIVQLECGPFCPKRTPLPPHVLAVLFPRTLMFLEMTAQGGGANERNAQSGDTSDADATPQPSQLRDLDAFYTLTVQSTVHLQSTAYNFASGCFGNSDYRMICVQSMDGLLTILDYTGVLYRTFLPPNQFLIPGPIRYNAHRDALLTCNTSMFLLSYSYSSIVLGSTAESAAATTADPVAATCSPNLGPLWAFNLGEDAVDIEVCRLTRGLPNDDVDIVVLCTSVLYVLNDSGEPRLMRRIDVEALSMCVYPLPDIPYNNLLVGTINGLVQVYSDTELQWSTSLAGGTAPLHLSVASLCGVKGMIVCLSSEGALSINYLGTDPVEHRPKSLDTNSSSYTEIVQDLKHWEKLIQQYLGNAATGHDDADKDDPFSIPGVSPRSTGAASPKAQADGKVEMKDVSSATTAGAAPSSRTAAVAMTLSITSEFSSVNTIDNSAEFTVTLQTHKSDVSQVSLVLQSVPPLIVTPTQCALEHITPGSSVQRTFSVSAIQDRDLIIPSSLEVVVVAVYRGQRREYETTDHVALAPLLLVARPVPPVKNTAFSLQLNTDHSPPPLLTEIFSDMALLGNVASNILSLNYLNGSDATVLVSKNAARFKFQGSTMEGLWLLASEVKRRVQLHCSGDGELRFEIPHNLPVPDFLAVVDTHWAIRKEVDTALTSLDQAAALFRAVEKRLLARFRDRSPADATAVEVLFQESYSLLQEKADATTRAKSRLRQASAMLNCCAQLLWFCLEVKSPSLSPQDAATLSALFRCSVSDENESGWEEVTEAVLSKMLDVKSRKIGTHTVELSSSISNLKRYLVTLMNAVQSGQKLGTA